MNALLLEDFLVVQMDLRHRGSRENSHWLFELEVAIASLTSGERTPQVETVERFVLEHLTGAVPA